MELWRLRGAVCAALPLCCGDQNGSSNNHDQAAITFRFKHGVPILDLNKSDDLQESKAMAFKLGSGSRHALPRALSDCVDLELLPTMVEQPLFGWFRLFGFGFQYFLDAE